MHVALRIVYLLVALGLLAASGCAKTHARATGDDAVPAGESAADSSDEQRIDAEDTEPPAQSQFKPPFPDRVELFVPPNRPKQGKRPRSRDTADVELKGFIDVDGPKVLLSFDGQVKALAAGCKSGGVQVVEIRKPAVTLKRGQTTWTESLLTRQ